MGPIGYQEMVLIFIVALLLFGPKKLPEIGRTVAKAIGEFRKASNDLKDTWQREMSNIDRETSDVRADINKEVQKITDEANNYVQPYSESYYGSGTDSNYDYGAYGYPDSTTTAAAATTEAAAVTGEATGDAAGTAAGDAATVETASNASAGEPVSTIDTAPSVTPAAGTVSTGGTELTASAAPAPTTPAEPAAPAPGETPKA